MSMTITEPPVEAPPAGFALSPQQLRLWQLDGDSRTTGTIEITGELDVTTFVEAFRDVSERHEILRTHCRCLPGAEIPVQVVAEPWVPELLPPEPEAQVVEQLTAGRLSPQSRSAALCQVGEDRYLLRLDLPALCADQPTLALVAHELADAHARRLDPGSSAGEMAEPMQYADVAQWQNQLLDSEEASEERRYWRHRGADQRLGLPFSRSEADEEASWDPRWQVPELDDERMSELLAEAPESFLLACWTLFLGRMSGQRDVPVAVACHGRTYEELEGALGPLTRFLPASFRVSLCEPFETLQQAVAETLDEAREYQEYFDWAEAGLAGPPGEPRFLDAAFELCDAAARPSTAGPRFELLRGQSFGDRFRLKLSALRRSQGLHLRLDYDAGAFSEEAARRLCAAFERLLSSALENPRSAAGDLELLPESEWRRLRELNDTRAARPAPETLLHGRFEEQAARHPGRPALVAGADTLTYGELEARSNRLARHLGRLGVGAETLVAVCTDRSPQRVVGVLGVLKSGAGYVPLDPGFPAERLALILDDCGAEVLLAEPHLVPKLPAEARQGCRIVLLDEETGSGESPERPGVEVAAENVAYLIYTSGSTGRPKGVVVRHRGVAERIAWVQSRFPLEEDDRVLHRASFAFDASLREIFWPLSTGAVLVMAPEGADRDIAQLAAVMVAERVTVVHFVPPSLLAVFLEEEEVPATLRQAISGGEALPPAVARRFREHSEAALHNSYGPTEVSIHATFFTCGEAPDDPMPIGLPLANTTAWVVDPRLRPVPSGVVGELVIGGPALARGYRSEPGPTAERFVPDPWSSAPGERLYLTGDLARRLDDGRLEWCGRLDDQIKVRGFRVEPLEIEAVLVAHPAVSQVVVTASAAPGGNAVHLAAFFVATDSAAPSSEELRGFLAERLPAFMVPAAFVPLKSLPRTSTGKVDRRALPSFAEVAAQALPVYAAPRTAVEEILARIYAEVLGVERVGIHDDFFALGGNSILVTRLASRVRRAFRLELPLREMFEAVSVAEMAELLTRYEPVPGQSEKIAVMLHEIKAMSPQDRQALAIDLTEK